MNLDVNGAATEPLTGNFKRAWHVTQALLAADAPGVAEAMHGGIGATWEHDAHLYWRHAQLSRLLLGGVAGAGECVAEEIIARARGRDRSTA